MVVSRHPGNSIAVFCSVKRSLKEEGLLHSKMVKGTSARDAHDLVERKAVETFLTGASSPTLDELRSFLMVHGDWLARPCPQILSESTPAIARASCIAHTLIQRHESR